MNDAFLFQPPNLNTTPDPVCIGRAVDRNILQVRQKDVEIRMRDLYAMAQAGVVTFDDVVCPRPIVANAKAAVDQRNVGQATTVERTLPAAGAVDCMIRQQVFILRRVRCRVGCLRTDRGDA